MRKLFFISIFIFSLIANTFAGQVIVQSQQTFESMTPATLTAYKALSFINADSMAISAGSAIGSSVTVSETIDSNNGAICVWYYPYNYGNAGQTRYLFDCYVDANNRVSLYINASNDLVLDVIGAGTTRTASTSFASIKPFTWNHIVATWSKNVDVNATNNSYIYLNGSGAGQTSATVAMASLPSSFYIGSDYNSKQSANGLIAYKIMRYWMSSTQVTADYNSGSGSLEFFTRTPHTIAMGLTSENSTGVAYVHTGQTVSTISTVTLTLGQAIGGRSWTNGDQVVVWDDADPPNVVRTTINGVPSGSAIVVADSCAGIVGTNKFISKNLLVDSTMGLSTTSAWTAGANTTLSKNTTAPISDTNDLKILNTSTTQGKATQAVTTISNADYYLYGLIKPQITPSASASIISVDGTASMSQTVGQAKLMGKNVSSFSPFSTCLAANNSIFNITNQDFSISLWFKIGRHGNYIFGKIASGQGYYLQLNSTSINLLLKDATIPTTANITALTINELNTWFHIAIVIDRDNATNCVIYKNGIPLTTTITGTLANIVTMTNTGIFSIGIVSGYDYSYGYHADFKIAIGTVWSAAEVLYQYNNPFDISAGAGTITEAYACTEGTGTTLTALVGGVGNNLTLSSASAWNLGDVQEIEHCFEAGDTSTTIDLTVPSVVSGDIAYWDNLKLFVNMINNGGCEGGADPPTSWTQEANATVVSDTSPHAGTNCLKATAGADNVGAKQDVTLVSGQYYTIIGYAKATADDSARIIVDTGDTTLQTVGTVTATTWTRVRGSFKSTGTAGVVYLKGVTNTDVVWFDDIAILRDDVGNVTATKGSGILPENMPALIR